MCGVKRGRKKIYWCRKMLSTSQRLIILTNKLVEWIACTVGFYVLLLLVQIIASRVVFLAACMRCLWDWQLLVSENKNVHIPETFCVYRRILPIRVTTRTNKIIIIATVFLALAESSITQIASTGTRVPGGYAFFAVFARFAGVKRGRTKILRRGFFAVFGDFQFAGVKRGRKKIVRKSRSMFNIDQEIIKYKYSQTIFNWLWSDKSLQQDSFRKKNRIQHPRQEQ